MLDSPIGRTSALDTHAYQAPAATCSWEVDGLSAKGRTTSPARSYRNSLQRNCPPEYELAPFAIQKRYDLCHTFARLPLMVEHDSGEGRGAVALLLEALSDAQLHRGLAPGVGTYISQWRQYMMIRAGTKPYTAGARKTRFRREAHQTSAIVEKDETRRGETRRDGKGRDEGREHVTTR